MFKEIKLNELKNYNLKEWVVVGANEDTVNLRRKLTEKYVDTQIEEYVKDEVVRLIDATGVKDIDSLHKIFEYHFYKNDCQIPFIEQMYNDFEEGLLFEYGSDFDLPQQNEHCETLRELIYDNIYESSSGYVFANNKQWIEEVINEMNE